MISEENPAPAAKTAAFDFGSRFIKIAQREGEKTAFRLLNTVEFYKNHIVREKGEVFIDFAALELPEDTAAIATGYGRNLLAFKGVRTVSEIKAHFYGALEQTGERDFILTDIGGQDSKVICAKEGFIEDFIMNDKCAAATGRFIEHSAQILGIALEEFMLLTENPAKLTDTCAVFCESELMGHIARGVGARELAAGVNLSAAKRIAPHIKRFGRGGVYAAGGAAKSVALLTFLAELTGREVKALPNPQFNGAIGLLASGGLTSR